ncbi:MAG: TIGR02677 family protein [Erysipelotrichaceae bacterium]|nr:TIGR02677 family protein [Erysipelotrichaceae bacterium]MDD3810018.1 TIGR02677 family protein [Erysipelotrichaceae bacterium]
MQLEPIKQTSYLTALNAHLYRRIMRIVYLESTHYNYHLDLEKIMEKLENDEFEGAIDEPAVKNALDALVDWGNLTAIQDAKQVNTIAEFKARKFRYSISDIALEVERMVMKIENLTVKSNSASLGYLKRLYQEFKKILTLSDASEMQLLEWWEYVGNDFATLNLVYSDYLRDFSGAKSQKLMQSLEFLQHKEYFVRMLKDFVTQLQIYAIEFEKILISLDPNYVTSLLERIVTAQKKNPSSLGALEYTDEKYLRDGVFGRYSELQRWFVKLPGSPSEVEQIMDRTNVIIRQIIQNAGLIIDFHEGIISKKDDYRHYLKLFGRISDLGEAHKLAAHLFGVHDIRHYQTNAPRLSESSAISTFAEAPQVFEVKPMTRKYRIKQEKITLVDRSLEKQLQIQAHQAMIASQIKIANTYIKAKRIDFKDIVDEISPATRLLLLSWVASANGTIDKVGTSEFGRRFKLMKMDETITLRCSDGDLQMPRFILEFED